VLDALGGEDLVGFAVGWPWLPSCISPLGLKLNNDRSRIHRTESFSRCDRNAANFVNRGRSHRQLFLSRHCYMIKKKKVRKN
jgi:hypothetical protein